MYVCECSMHIPLLGVFVRPIDKVTIAVHTPPPPPPLSLALAHPPHYYLAIKNVIIVCGWMGGVIQMAMVFLCVCNERAHACAHACYHFVSSKILKKHVLSYMSLYTRIFFLPSSLSYFV